MARTVEQLAEDKIYVVTTTGDRLGPYKAAVNSRRNTIEVFFKNLEARIGDQVERTVPPDRLEVYEILDIHYEIETYGVYAPYSLDVQRKGAPVRLALGGISNTFNISGDSPNIQVGDHNVQNVLSVMQSLVKEIEKSDATPEQKADARRKLQEFLSHPLVTSIMGSAAGTWVASLSS